MQDVLEPGLDDASGAHLDLILRFDHQFVIRQGRAGGVEKVAIRAQIAE
jgi:hypothetical protein